MKLFVVLLALKLIATEKLDRRYLPPPNAKFSGGRSDDLQTPLKYPKSGYEGIAYVADDGDSVQSGSPDEIAFSSMAIKGPYYKSILHLRSGVDNPTGNFDFGVDNPGNMPIVAVPESIGQNYQPHLFGMYGGNPMSIKYFNNNIEVASSDNLLTSSKKTVNPQTEQYLTTTSSPNEGTVATGQNMKTTGKKFERPQENSDRSAIVLNYENIQNLDEYFYHFDTSNEIHRNESASTAKGVKAKGSYSYKGDDDKVYTVTYTADENGFQPSGDHLPVIPEAIQNVIEQTQMNKDAGIIDDGSYDETKYGHMKYQGPVHRYLQKNAKTHKRKMVTGKQKTPPSKFKKYETNNIMNSSTENVQPTQNKNRKPSGTKRVQVFNNRKNEEDEIYIQKPKENQNYTSDYSQNVNNKKSMVSKNIESNLGILNSNTEKKLQIPITYNGYYYIPPENIFVDGRYQDKVFADDNFNNSSDLETKFNTDDQRNKNYFSDKAFATEEPFYQKAYDGDFYASKNDVDQSNHNTKKASSSKKSGTETTELYGNSNNTKLYDNDFTKEIVKEEETVIPDNRSETDLFSSQIDFNTGSYQSTTPMSSETGYIHTYKNINQYETTLSESALTTSNFDLDYSENEGYFKTPPEPASCDDFSSSTYYTNVYTTEETVGTESTTNVKVDDFGRTSQESFDYSTNSYNDNSTNGMPKDSKSKVSLLHNDNEETLRTDKPNTLDDKSITQFPNEFGSDVNRTPEDLRLGLDSIIGEDFSGPKQPQRYDPKQGYYY